MLKMNKIIKYITFILSVSISPLFAGEHTQTINNLQQDISEINKKISEIESDIKNTDQQIADRTVALNKITTEIKKNELEQFNLKQDYQKNIENLAKQKEILIKQLESIYLLHRNKNQEKITNLNKINDIKQLNRYLTYLKTFNQYHIENINNLKLTIKKLTSVEENLKLIENQQNQLKKTISASFHELTLLKANNLRLKNELEQSLTSSITKLNYHKSQQKKLDNILISSNSTNRSFTLNKDTGQFKGLFYAAKGRLPLPIEGKINTQQTQNKSTNSIFIEAPEGKKVAAIFSGKIVFSNWLRGFGFITIIDHSNGYMSLYGNNQVLLKKTDDFVEAGETIALTGSSGGISTPGLYFEIRHNGASVNTLAWLKTDTSETVAKL